MRIVVVLAALAVLAGCGEDDTEQPAQAPSQFADLTVTVNDGSKTKTAQITCNAASDSKECAALAELDAKWLEPTPGNRACTQQYGGPETATLKGTLHDKAVDAKFSRVNGCEIARWNAAKDVFAAAG
jgi:ABC-type glycerol-3-phosphate transport system substrate-binding protein